MQLKKPSFLIVWYYWDFTAAEVFGFFALGVKETVLFGPKLILRVWVTKR